MIQDIFPKKFYNQYSLRTEPSAEDKAFMMDGSKILLSKVSEEEISFPSVGELGEGVTYTYLFSIDDEKYFLAESDMVMAKYAGRENRETSAGAAEGAPASDYTFTELQAIREMNALSNEQMLALFTGKHLADWYRDNRFCGRCGAKMEHHDKERAMKCPCCGYTAYPRIMPAVIVGVLNNDRILLTKYRVGYRHFALVAGFAEIGESIEETVAREVMEEVGLRVKNIRYYKSQPWGLANDLLLGFFCEVDGDPSISMDADELKYAEWVTGEDVELQPNSLSLTNEMMQQFKEGKV